MEKEKSVFDVLSAINVNAYTEKKENLTYLSWSWAWTFVKQKYPNSRFEINEYNGRPYIFDEDLGYMVKTTVTINDDSLSMVLPVMDSKNKAMKKDSYEYKTKFGNKTVEKASMFDINTAIMRCLVKNIALFGLGLYIYQGEDVPDFDIQKEISKQISLVTCKSQLIDVYKSLSPDIQKKYLKLFEEKSSYFNKQQ